MFQWTKQSLWLGEDNETSKSNESSALGNCNRRRRSQGSNRWMSKWTLKQKAFHGGIQDSRSLLLDCLHDLNVRVNVG